jgi:hypothetical protein
MAIPLLAVSGNLHSATHLFELHWETYSRYWLNNGKLISAISGLLPSISYLQQATH